MNDAAIHAGTDEAALEHVLKQVLVLALLATDHRSENQKTGALRQGQNARDDLFPRLGGDRPAALGTVALADAGVEDAEVVVNLGNGADGRAWISARRLLLDTDGRRQAAQVI